MLLQRYHRGSCLLVLSVIFGTMLSAVLAFPKEKSRRTDSPTPLRAYSLPGAGHSLLALDFDGVLCASSGESSYSSIVAAERFWASECTIEDRSSQEFNLVRSAVNAMRPIVETGFENMLLVRLIIERMRATGGRPVDTTQLMAEWSPKFRDSLVERFQTTKPELIEAFGSTRDSLIAKDLTAWVNLNEIYPCVKSSLSNSFILPKSLNCKIITTKQKRFVRAILETNDVYCPADDDIFDLDNPFGPKVKVLAELLKQLKASNPGSMTTTDTNPNPNTNPNPVIHFVEDRFETLEAVMKTPGLEAVELYLVDWGYNTEQQREAARALHPRVRLIDGEDFQQLIRRFIR